MKQQIDLKLMEEIKCEKCNNNTFDSIYFLRLIPASLSETGFPGLTPINAFACAGCGHINKMFQPFETDE